MTLRTRLSLLSTAPLSAGLGVAEILAFADAAKEFEARNTQVIGVSVDSKFSHHAWVNTPRKDGGINGNA